MLPSFDQIQREAYFRWLRRGYAHGHAREDWVAAEQDLLFSLNYEVAAHYLIDGASHRTIGDPHRRVCRFCELTEPAATFSEGRLALPEFVGNRSLFTREECDECHEQFREGIEAELGRFLAFLHSGMCSEPGAIPLAALKGLVKLALAVMPRGDLPDFESAVEWVGNPDHELDAGLFQTLGCLLHRMSGPFPHPWAALARRVDDEAPVPALLFFLGTSDVVLELSVPLGERDEDHEGEPLLVPRTCGPFTSGLGGTALSRTFLPVAPAPRRPLGRRLLDPLLNPPPR